MFRDPAYYPVYPLPQVGVILRASTGPVHSSFLCLVCRCRLLSFCVSWCLLYPDDFLHILFYFSWPTFKVVLFLPEPCLLCFILIFVCFSDLFLFVVFWLFSLLWVLLTSTAIKIYYCMKIFSVIVVVAFTHDTYMYLSRREASVRNLDPLLDGYQRRSIGLV